MKKLLLLAVLAGLSASCAQLYRLSNTTAFRLKDSSFKRMLVIHNHLDNRLGWLDKKGKLSVSPYLIGALPEYTGPVYLSPGQSALAVLSVGEGHPAVSVYAMHELLEAQSNGSTEINAVIELNPYPGWISLEGWTRDGQLRLSSSVNPLYILQDSAPLTESDSVWKWQLDMERRAIRVLEVQ